MAQKPQFESKRVGSYGRTGTIKRDGYATGPVPEAARGVKVGKTDREGYSGPATVIPSRG